MARKAGRQTSQGARRVSRGDRAPVLPPRRPAITRTAFPIAVVGASAGGLEAFRRLLSALPAQSGLSLILVPHLDPDRESHLTGLLAAVSAMPVAEARDGRLIRRNHVYVIPPGRLLTVHGGRLALTPLPDPRAGASALDVALRSLAEDQGTNAMAIILSGTGSYGTAGAKTVLAAGGLVLAQDPATAQYDQMPRSAAAAGVQRQHVLAPESMAPVLLARAGSGHGPRAPRVRSARFFQDPDALDALVTQALPGLVARASDALPVRVWVPECGAGEEAYSITILLLERLEAAGKGAALKVFATDSDAESLRAARRGTYPRSIAGEISPDRLARFFTLLPTGEYQVWSELRRGVVFGQVDPLKDPPISKLDLLVFRAPSEHLRPDERARLIARLFFALNPGGYLLLGPGGGAGAAASELFETLSVQAALYRRRTQAPHLLSGANGVAVREGAPQPRIPLRAVPLESVAEGMDHAPRERLASAAIPMKRCRLPDTVAPEEPRSNVRAVLARLERAPHDLEASSGQPSPVSEEPRTAQEELRASSEERLATSEERASSRVSPQERITASDQVEAQLRAVLDATVDAVVTIDTEGKILTFNGSAARMFGYSLQEVIGRNVNMLLPPEMRAMHDQCLACYRKTHQRHIIGASREVVAYRRGGTRFPALLSVSESANSDLLVGCIRDLSMDKMLQEEILHIAALEQQRIGQELHDGIQQELTGLGLLAQNLYEALRQPRGPASDAELAQRIASGIAEANRHVRSLARGLVPVPVDATTLPAALAELARNMQRTYNLSCRLDAPTSLTLPDAATATHLYRIAQEAAGNAAKHAKANDLLIRLSRDGDELRLVIEDDGIGIPQQPAGSGGVGLRLMEHRCAALGGRFMIEPRAGGGTSVSCTIPFLRRS